MSCSVLQSNDAASLLADDSTVFGMPVSVIREIARMRKNVKNGRISLIVVHDRDDRVMYEESVKLSTV